MKTDHGIKKLGTAALAIATLLPSTPALGIAYDLTAAGSQSLSVAGDIGGTAIFADFWLQPAGTGVFDPFLTIDANGQTSTGNNNIEQGYNTAGHVNLFMDQHRPEWNNLLRISDLASVNLGGINYFAFILDANEPGNANSLISIDNIRIYTSSADNTANVGDDNSLLDDLGIVRWAMNSPLNGSLNGFNVDDWIVLDAGQENVSHGNANGGSGQADMIAYIPQSAFGDSLGTDDLVWFYNLNGVHYSQNGSLAAESGFEEWSAVVGPQSVPDNGNTLALLGTATIALFLFARRQFGYKS